MRAHINLELFTLLFDLKRQFVSRMMFFQFREDLCEDVVARLAHLIREELAITPKDGQEKPQGKIILMTIFIIF